MRYHKNHYTHLYEFEGRKYKAKSKDQVLRSAGLGVYKPANRLKVKILRRFISCGRKKSVD